jgi:hypothetical protein
MIPAGLFVQVIQAERQRDLERWERVRAAKAAVSDGPARRSTLRARVAFRPGRWLGRPGLGRARRTAPPCPEHAAGSAACC